MSAPARKSRQNRRTGSPAKSPLRLTLAAENVAQATISLAFVDNATIHDLNRRHLSHDYETDVLSFLLDCEQVRTAESTLPRPGDGKALDGEVVVSAEMAAQRAAEFGWNPHDELSLYIVHGLLHLAGYDDSTSAERSRMQQREREVLMQLGINAKHEQSP